MARFRLWLGSESSLNRVCGCVPGVDESAEEPWLSNSLLILWLPQTFLYLCKAGPTAASSFAAAHLPHTAASWIVAGEQRDFYSLLEHVVRKRGGR